MSRCREALQAYCIENLGAEQIEGTEWGMRDCRFQSRKTPKRFMFGYMYVEELLPEQLVKVTTTQLVVIIETFIAGNCFTALSCCDFKGRRPRTVGDPVMAAHDR